MEGSGMWISPSKSTASPKRGNNENDPSQFKITPKSLYQKEKSSEHHFMLPTISASSKAAPPRKKILSERNQNSFDPYSRDIDPKRSMTSSSRKAYNPLMNYLSPRPKYLCFNPNRQMEISSRLVKEELSNGSFDSQEEVNAEESGDSCFCPSIDDVIKPSNEVNKVEEEEDEEEEEVTEEEKGWNLNGVLKFLLTLIAFVLSTSYICTMNSPVPSPGQQAILKVKDGYYMVKRQTLEVFGVKGQEGRFLEEADYDEFEGDGCFEEVNGENEESTEGRIIDGVEHYEESVNVGVVENDVGNSEVVENDEVRNRKIVENSEKVVNELLVNATEDSEDKTDEVVEVEDAVYADQFDVKCEDFDRLVDTKTDDIVVNARGVDLDNSKMKPEPESYEQLQMEMTKGAGSVDQNKAEAGDFMIQTVDTNTDEVLQIDEKTEAPESGMDAEHGSYEQQLEMEIKGTDQFHELQLLEKSESHGFENNDNLGRKNEAFIGVSLISVILASLGFIYSLKRGPGSSSSLVEKSEAVVLKAQKLEVEDKRKIEFFARPSLLQQQSTAGATPQNLNRYNIYAPSVELMGEIVVGQTSRRGIRKYGAESELPQPAVSTTSSLPYGGFTTSSKILKKEGGQSGEFTVGGTPVRRSSRLRNRAAAGMSR